MTLEQSGALLATKAARHGMILEILATQPISSQEQLRQELAAQGIETAQATLSRDLLEMQATKVRTTQGTLVYSVPDIDGSLTHEPEASSARLVRWCQDLLIAGDIAKNFVVLRTPVGAANLLASAIDSARLSGVLGTIAGDDTILMICRTDEVAEETYAHLLELAEPSLGQSSNQRKSK